MQDKQYDMLMKAANEHAYMSIAINSDGTPVRRTFIPWERTVSAFNMKKPIITLAVADLQDKDIMNALKKCALEGCYIYTALADYSFIADFIELKDLYILHGEHMSDLSFIRHLSKLFMFYLEGATLPDLNPLIVSAKYSCGFPNFQASDIMVVDRYLDYFTTIMEDRLWQVLAKPGFRWRNRSGLSMNAAKAA